MSELPYYLHCYRNEDKIYALRVGDDYHPSGQGSLCSQHFVNPYTGKEYEANTKGELGFTIENNKYANRGSARYIYFSEDPKSDIFYGKWFFTDEEYTQWVREYKLDELLIK